MGRYGRTAAPFLVQWDEMLRLAELYMVDIRGTEGRPELERGHLVGFARQLARAAHLKRRRERYAARRAEKGKP